MVLAFLSISTYFYFVGLDTVGSVLLDPANCGHRQQLPANPSSAVGHSSWHFF